MTLVFISYLFVCLSYVFIVCVGKSTHMCATVNLWRLGDTLWASILTLFHVGTRSSGLVASAFSHGTIYRPQCSFLNKGNDSVILDLKLWRHKFNIINELCITLILISLKGSWSSEFIKETKELKNSNCVINAPFIKEENFQCFAS